MPGSIRGGLLVVLAWTAIGACATELMERRQDVLAMVEGSSLSWVSGVMSYVSEGIVESDN
jgi:hypothetical protein